jgi:hypothetical protein
MERAKIGEDPLRVFKISPLFLLLVTNIYRNAVLQRKEMEIVTFYPIAGRQLCLVCYWLTAGFWHFPAAFQHSLRIAQRLSNSLWAFPSAFPVPFKQCPGAVQ